MANKILKNKRGLIFGVLNEKSIAWEVAKACHAEGAKLVLTNAPLAVRFGEINTLAKIIKAPVIGTDITKISDLENLLDNTIRYFKGNKIDFILHSVAMSVNIRKKHAYTDLNYDYNQKTLDVSAISLHKLLQTAFAKNAISEWGSVVALSFIAAQRVFPGYNEMADAKLLLEGIARNFGYHYGSSHKVRINTISQSPTFTTAGEGIKDFNLFYEYSNKMSPLGNAPVRDLANFCTMLFSDYTRYVTMQNLFHDGGFSSTGMTEKLAQKSTS